MTVDVGAGDGRAVLAAAARDPRTLHLGLEPVAASMAEASRRAARPPRKGGLPNARFIVGAAEAYPAALRGLAAAVTVRFPWASLLRGCLGRDPGVSAGVAGLVARGGTLELLLAPAGRDRLEGLPTEPEAAIAAARSTFEGLGLACLEARPATPAEVQSSGSTWARRLLGAGRDRAPVIVRFRSQWHAGHERRPCATRLVPPPEVRIGPAGRADRTGRSGRPDGAARGSAGDHGST